MKRKRIIFSDVFTKFEAKPEPSQDGFNKVLILAEGPAKGHMCVEQQGRLKPFNPDDPEHAKLEKIPIFITADTLQQVADSGNARSEVKAKLDQRGDHAGGVSDTFGGYSNFRVEGNGVYADLKFLEGTPHRSFIEGIASRFADEFGNSINHKVAYKLGKDASGQKIAIANCLHLASVDLVDSPAATNSLFEEQDSPSPSDSMPLSPEDLATISDMITKAVADAAAADKKQDAATIEERLAKLEANAASMNPDGDKKDTEAKEKKDADADTPDEKLAAQIEKAALKVAQETFQKLSTGFVKTNDGDGDKVADKFEAAIQAQLSSGCKSRGLAIHRVAADNPELYNEAAKNGKL